MNRIEATHRSRIPILTTVLAVFALSATGTAETAKSHKGDLVIKTQTVVQGTTLPPGDYEVREVQTAHGTMVEFVRRYWNDAALEMVQAEEEQVVSQVPVIEQPLSAPARHTQLELSSDRAGATALQIRGAAVDFVFEPIQNANQPVRPTTVVGSN